MSQKEEAQWACSGPILPSSDLRLGRRLGLQIYQLTLDWSHLQPKGRRFRCDPAHLEPYDRVVDHLLEQDLEPQFCLFGGELPPSLQVDGGWAVRDTAKRFVDYADGVSRRLGDRVERWLTIQDLSKIASLESSGLKPALSPSQRYLSSIHHLLLAHAWAGEVVCDNVRQPKIEVELRCPEPEAGADRDNAPSHHRWLLDPLEARGYPEEGLHDRRDEGVFENLRPEFVEDGDIDRIGQAVGGIQLIVDWPWEEARYDHLNSALERVRNRPLSLHLRQANEAEKPTHPARDERRTRTLIDQLETIAEIIRGGLEIQQLQLGPLLDEEHWSDGTEPRQGLVWVDPETRRRWPKSSGLALQRVLVECSLERNGH